MKAPLCYHLAMAMTLRLPEALKSRANAMARELGISVNALVAVALRDYLDARHAPKHDLASAQAPVPSGLDRKELLAVQELLDPEP